MILDKPLIKPGAVLIDPIGRKCEIEDIFVPKNQPVKRCALPASFRYVGRKVIVFKTGGVMHLSDVEKRYSLAS